MSSSRAKGLFHWLTTGSIELPRETSAPVHHKFHIQCPAIELCLHGEKTATKNLWASSDATIAFFTFIYFAPCIRLCDVIKSHTILFCGYVAVSCLIVQPIPVAARYKALVCGRSVAGIVVSNPAGYGCLSLWSIVFCLRRAGHSYRRVLPSVVYPISVIAKPRKGRPSGRSTTRKKKKKLDYFSICLRIFWVLFNCDSWHNNNVNCMACIMAKVSYVVSSQCEVCL